MVIIVAIAASIFTLSSHLEAQEDQRPGKSALTVAILVFDGVQIIDFTGPYEVFGSDGSTVFTVSQHKDTVTSTHGMDVIPDYGLNHHPDPDIVVVPGGSVAHRLNESDPRIVWLKSLNDGKRKFLGVCNGVFILSSAGLLDGREATTVATMLDHLKSSTPAANIIYDRRYTEDGNIFTCGGFTASIDGAIGVLKSIYGDAHAQLLANNLEYNWHPQSEYVRYQLADIWIPLYLDIFPPLFDRDIIKYEGDKKGWKAEYLIRRDESVSELAQQLNQVATMYGWTQTRNDVDDKASTTIFEFKDYADRSWSLESKITRTEREREMRLEIKTLRND